MENCPRFRRVMLHFGAGYPRVTHPFAALSSKLVAHNLHAFDTLPAFVLSQDQTLINIDSCPERYRIDRWFVFCASGVNRLCVKTNKKRIDIL